MNPNQPHQILWGQAFNYFAFNCTDSKKERFLLIDPTCFIITAHGKAIGLEQTDLPEDPTLY